MSKTLQFITVASAASIIEQAIPSVITEIVPAVEAAGRILGENIIAERDHPPYDRVMMDGVAICSTGNKGTCTFLLQGKQKAGQPPLTLKGPEYCFKIFTGAVLPKGCNRVVPVENITVTDGSNVIIDLSSKKDKYIHPKGRDSKKGDILCRRGEKIGPAQIMTAAGNGKQYLKVLKKPSIILISTGDEIIGSADKPAPYEIRSSNVYGIAALLRVHGFQTRKILFSKDNTNQLKKVINRAFNSGDVIISIGGVSMGETDLVPEVLKDLNIKIVFHKVKQKPGKPLLFGVQAGGVKNHPDKFYFGLPGNPVSAMVCMRRYVIPFLLRMSGERKDAVEPVKTLLSTKYEKENALTAYVPVKILKKNNILYSLPVPVSCSGDQNALLESDGFIEIPEKTKKASKCTEMDFYSWTP